MNKGAALVLKTVEAIDAGGYTLTPQPEKIDVKHAPKIFKETCEINWNQASEQVRNFVRGLSPYPAAWTTFNGKVFKIFKVSLTSHPATPGEPGNINSDNKNYLYVSTSNGWVSIDDLQPEGKKRMTVQEFFRGNKI
jgi:methionyl-tRNA formyltransferase